jgi:hypothetical protein
MKRLAFALFVIVAGWALLTVLEGEYRQHQRERDNDPSVQP